MAISERRRLTLTAIAVIIVGVATGLLLGGALLPQAITTLPQQYDIETTVEETTLGHTHNGSTHTHTTTITITETTPHTTFHAPSIPSVTASSATAPSVTATTVPTQSQGTNEVTIVGYAFGPDTIVVPMGTTVTWTNLDFTVHTVSSDTGLFESHGLPRPNSYYPDWNIFSYTFTQPGTYAYHCTPHDYMAGTVIVEE